MTSSFTTNNSSIVINSSSTVQTKNEVLSNLTKRIKEHQANQAIKTIELADDNPFAKFVG